MTILISHGERMPSAAFNKFESKMLKDVDRLIESHAELGHDGPGRHGLGHITRSGVFLLCAAWELYLEELAQEVASFLADRAASPKDLPLGAQKELSKLVKNHSNELKPLELAGNGWERIYLGHVNEAIGKLNTPKSGPVDELYRRLLGWENPSTSWTRGHIYINDFVEIRGDIAHRGSDARYVRIDALREDYRVGIPATVIEHDNAACDFVNDNSNGPRPWRRRT